MTVGIDQSKELMVSLIRLGKLAAKHFGDGVDLSDAIAIIKVLADEEFRKAIFDGFEGIQSVPAEMKDIDAEEAVQLIGTLYAELQK